MKLEKRSDEAFAALLQAAMLNVNGLLGQAAERGLSIELEIHDHTGVADRSKCYHIEMTIKKVL